MAFKPFLFNKDHKDRLLDFKNVLNSNLKASEIKRVWSDHIELTIEPIGWRAIWKISREICMGLKINYPSTVIVSVDQVNYSEHSCLVSCIEVEDDSVHLPEQMMDVPLIELYPIAEQENSSVLSLYETAQLIDSLRFFYHHLWMPWDLDFDDDISWVTSHLENRLHLYFSIMDNAVPQEVTHAIRKIVNNGFKVVRKIEDIQEQLLANKEVKESSDKVLQLAELHNQLCNLMNQYTIYEKPDLLKALISKKENTDKCNLELQDIESVGFVVLPTSSPGQFLKLANLTTGKKLTRLWATLQEALVEIPHGAALWLVQGTHSVRDLANLETGGSITGVEEGVMLVDDAETSSDITVLGGTFTLTNLTLHITNVWNIVKIRPNAECYLNDIKLEGSILTDGIDIYSKAKLVAVNCTFSNCRTALVCDASSTIVLSNCFFTDNCVAIEMNEGCHLSMENCVISGSKTFGINILFPKPVSKNDFPSDTINSVSHVKEHGTIFKNNAMDVHFLCNSFTSTDIIDKNF